MPDFPKRLKRANCQVTIYAPTKKESRFRVYWRFERKRFDKKFPVYKDALAFAETLLERLVASDVPPLAISTAEFREFRRAASIADRAGYSLGSAIDEWRAARDRLPDGFTLADAVDRLSQRRQFGETSVDTLVEAYLGNAAGKLSPAYARQVKGLLGRFKESFRCAVQDLQKRQINEFLDSQSKTQKTRSNHAGILTRLLNWGIDNDYLPSDTGLLRAIKSSSKTPQQAVSFYTSDEFQTMLENAPPPIKARLLLVGLCGLRQEEALRVHKGSIRGEYIEVAADQAKTKKRRLAPIPAAMAQMLLNRSNEFAFDVPYPNDERCFHREYSKLRKSSEIVSKRNGLRHSFLSYRLALVKDKNVVADEAGTSVDVIHRNYRELVTPEEARHWFAVRY